MTTNEDPDGCLWPLLRRFIGLALAIPIYFIIDTLFGGFRGVSLAVAVVIVLGLDAIYMRVFKR